MRTTAFRAVLIVLTLAAVSCDALPQGQNGQRPSGRQYNVLLITVDTLRADHLSSYGHAYLRTPVMDGIAATGVRFDQAYTTVPATLPAHTSILTGAYPPNHGVRSNGIFRARDSLNTLAELLRDRGYSTSAVIGAVVLSSVYGLNQGFDIYDDAIQGGSAADLNLIHAERNAEAVTRRAQELIRQRPDKPFFLWAHYFDPHTLYQPPQRFAEQYPQSSYAGEIAYVDEQIGLLLATLKAEGVDDKTVIVLTGDHGEGLGEHGEDIHGVLLYDSTVRVPLMLSYPGIQAAVPVVTAPVSVVDILPTVMDVLGIDTRDFAYGIQGKSLLPLVAGKVDRLHDEIYFESLLPYFDYGWSALRGVRRDEWKFISSPAPALFDIGQDPAEQNNLFEERDDKVLALQVAMEELVDAITVDEETYAEIDDETRAELASLGYVSGAANTRIDENPFRGPDPEPRIRMVTAINKASFIYLQGQRDEALRELSVLIAEEPENPTVLGLLGILNNDLGRTAAAMDNFESLVRVQPNREANWSNLGIAYRRQNRVNDAARAFQRALDINPNHVNSLYSLALIAMERRDNTKAEVGLKRVVELDPRHASARNWLGAIYASRRDFRDAVVQLKAAIELDPTLGVAHKNLASCYMSLNDNKNAAIHVAEAQRLGIQIHPAVIKQLQPYLSQGGQP